MSLKRSVVLLVYLIRATNLKKLMFAVSFQDTVTASHSHLISVSLLTALTSLTSINRGKSLSETVVDVFHLAWRL